jgi:hypothetical protein
MTEVRDPAYAPASFDVDPRSAIGPIVSAFEVEHALAECVRRWQRDYLAEVCRQRALEPEQLQPYRSIVVSSEIEKMPEDQTPTLIVASTGVAAGGRPLGIRERGTGQIDARFGMDVASLISARGNREALRLARLYTAAVRALLLQQALAPTSELELARVEWTAERYGPAPLGSEADRTIALGVASFVVDAANITNWQLGPREPLFEPTEPTEPPPPFEYPEAISHEIDVDKKE